ncbi:MAG: LPP20 family lipoprotein [Spirochaetaceae bacterium]|nr:LPP20 family lipoprotein [Spirochaetaceae bacterium]
MSAVVRTALIVCLIFMGCQSTGSGLSSGKAGKAGDNVAEVIASATAAMDSVLSGSSRTSAASGGPVPTISSGGVQPRWVSSPESVYDRKTYIAAVGYGDNRDTAERRALAALTAIFGQSIQSEAQSTVVYSEALINGAMKHASGNNDFVNLIKTSVEMDSLVGAEIKDLWFDGKGTYYAAAVMERAKTTVLYKELVNTNVRLVNDLTAIPDGEKYTLDGLRRFQLAAVVADANTAFLNVLRVLGDGSAGNVPGNIKTGSDYRLEIAAITKNIPIGIVVENDQRDRIRGAFAEVLTKAGFRSGEANAPYLLKVLVSMTPVDLPNNPNRFVRYVVDANLEDRRTGDRLLPYMIDGREGHLSIPEAENRAFRAAETKIRETYGPVLDAYISQLSTSGR